MNKILMNDFQKEFQFFKPEINKAINKVLASNYFILGDEVKKFENNFAKFIGTKYCVGVANGMEALQICLMSLGIGKGDEVITVSNSAVATSLAISNTGATPVFVDIDEYFHINVQELESKITKKTKAIIPVHLFGQIIDIKALLKIAGPAYGSKKQKLISNAIFVAFPSRHDEQSLWVLEALASGMPLVCFDLPESRWISKEVSLKASCFDLNQYSKLLLKATDDLLNEEMGFGARKLASNFDWEKVVDQFESYFRYVLFKETTLDKKFSIAYE